MREGDKEEVDKSHKEDKEIKYKRAMERGEYKEPEEDDANWYKRGYEAQERRKREMEESREMNKDAEEVEFEEIYD